MHHYCTTLPCGTGTEVYLQLEKVAPAGMALSSPSSPASKNSPQPLKT